MTTDKNHAAYSPLLQKIQQLRQRTRRIAADSVETLEGEILAITPLDDGKALLGIQLWDGFALARVDADLELDTTFGSDGSGFIEDVFGDPDIGFSAPYGVLVRGDRILLTGEYFDFWEYTSQAALAQYTLDGQVDASFGDSGKLILNLPQVRSGQDWRSLFNRSRQQLAKALQRSAAGHFTLDDDKIVLVLLASTFDNSDGITQLIRLNGDGSFDTSFNGSGVAHVRLQDQEITPGGVHRLEDGALLVYGGTQPLEDSTYAVVARYTHDGQLDAGFNAALSPGFILIGETYERARFGTLQVDAQGDIFAFGDLGSDVLMAHLKPQGHPAPEFNGGRPLRFLLSNAPLDRLYAVQPQGAHLVVAGTAFQTGKRHGVLMRLDRQGDLDPAFAGGQGYSVAPEVSEYFGLVIEHDDSILTAGYFADPEDKAWLKRHGVDGEGAIAVAQGSPLPTCSAGRRPA